MNAVMRPERLPQLKIRPGHWRWQRLCTSASRPEARSSSIRSRRGCSTRSSAGGRAGLGPVQVIVIDDDLGVSAAVPDSRKAFPGW